MDMAKQMSITIDYYYYYYYYYYHYYHYDNYYYYNYYWYYYYYYYFYYGYYITIEIYFIRNMAINQLSCFMMTKNWNTDIYSN